MSRRGASVVLLGLGIAGTAGAVAWIVFGSRPALAAGGAAPQLPPAPAPQDRATVQAAQDRAAAQAAQDVVKDVSVEIIDGVVPGLQDAAEQLQKALLADPNRVRAIMERYRRTAEKFAEQLAAQRFLTAQRMADAQGVLNGLRVADGVFDVIGKIPFVGQIIDGAYQIARVFAVAEADARTQGRSVFQPRINLGVQTFFGWLADPESPGQGDYWALNLPVLSYAAPIQLSQYRVATGDVYKVELQLLAALCRARPYGLDVLRVDCMPWGQYLYKFNVSGNNDISDAATERKEVYYVPVWNPADISPKGPRGFDPANPRAWYLRAKAEALGTSTEVTPAPPIDTTKPLGTPENPAPARSRRGVN